MYRRSASFEGKYKKVPLNLAQGLISAKSEGSIVTKKQLETRKFAHELPLQVAESSTRRNTMVESSDDDDEGFAVRIDSPSKIVFSDDL